MPKELRKFPVEQYLASGDWFIYRLSTKRNGQRDWRLHIVLSTDSGAGMWKNAFLAYLAPRGQCIEHVGPQKRWEPRTIYFRSNSRPDVSAVLEFKYAEPSGGLYITFAYYEPCPPNRLWGTKYGRFLASVLRRIGLPIDAVTQVS